MPKRVRRNDEDYLRFQPYRAIVAPPLGGQTEVRKWVIAAVITLVALGVIAVAAVYFFQFFRPML